MVKLDFTMSVTMSSVHVQLIAVYHDLQWTVPYNPSEDDRKRYQDLVRKELNTCVIVLEEAGSTRTCPLQSKPRE